MLAVGLGVLPHVAPFLTFPALPTRARASVLAALFTLALAMLVPIKGPSLPVSTKNDPLVQHLVPLVSLVPSEFTS